MDTELQVPTSSKERLNLQFQHLYYSVPRRKGSAPAHILRDVSGQFNSGRLTAIMGASGAGKTSLLNVLSGFKTNGVTGSVKVNGVERNPDEFRTKCCYIVQETAMLPLLTCKESLTVAANLKLKPGWKENKATSSVVTNILDLLGLTSVEHTSVQCLSGGQKKRLSVGLELVTNPPIMFFDEPTSGLDSVAAAQMILHLQTLSALGHAIICVIHQPSSHIFNMFDDLYLLSDGQCLYSGPTADMVRVFQQAGFTCPEYYNRADFAIEVACRQRGDDVSSLLSQFNSDEDVPEIQVDKVEHLHESVPMLTSQNVRLNGDKAKADLSIMTESKKKTYRRYPTSRLRQFWVILTRSLTCIVRDRLLGHLMLLSNIGIALLFGLFYLGIGNEASKVESNLGCLFIFLIYLHMWNGMTAAVTFPLEMSVFLQEHRNNWYSLISYLSAKITSSLPLLFMCQTCFMLIGYYMTDQPNELSRLLMAMLACQLLSIFAQSLGLVTGVVFEVQLGVFVVPTLSVPMFLFAGILLRLQDIAPYLKWLATISFFKHAYEAVVVAIYGFGREKLVCSLPYCHYKNPKKLLDDLGMSEDNYWWDIGGLCLWIGSMYVLLYVFLKIRIYRSQ